MSIDSNFYPLGSCTMKYNPKRNERLAALPGLAAQHPYQDESTLQGLLAILFDLQEILAEIAGLHAVSLQPAAGAQGELTALLVAAAYFRDRGEAAGARRSSSPTAPTAPTPPRPTSPGSRPSRSRATRRGLVDLDDFKAKLDDDTAVFMITNPNTVGLFDPQVGEIAALLARARGPALPRRRQHERHPRRRPAGRHGGRPDALQPAQDLLRPPRRRRPRRRPDRRPQAPRPLPARPARRPATTTGRTGSTTTGPKSIGRVRAFFGNTGVLFRAYCYIRSQGPDGLKAVSQHAVLNANYLMALVKHVYPVPLGDRCMHEFVASARGLARDRGVRAMDIGKRLIDYNFHAPTVYFPLIVPEALMIEPTETESRETLEAFAEVLLAIAAEDPQIAPRRPADHADQPARRGQGRARRRS